MNDRHTDDDLRARFDVQRTADAAHAPPFAAMLARAQAQRGRHRRLEWIGGFAAAAAIAAVVMIPRLRDGDDAFEEAVRAFQQDPALGAWQSPTDGLLKLPGDGLLTTIPAIGTAQ